MAECYTGVNSRLIDRRVAEGGEWGQPISHEEFMRAKSDEWSLLLTPTKPVPPDWFCPLQSARVLGLASGGGILLAGLDNGISYAFDEDARQLVRSLPFNPLKDAALYEESVANDWGIQFSHTIEEQVGGQLRAGFMLTDIFQDTSGSGGLHACGVPAYFATRAVRP